jgi:hypothetical protein
MGLMDTFLSPGGLAIGVGLGILFWLVVIGGHSSRV